MLHKHIATCRHFIAHHHKYAWVLMVFAILVVGGIFFKKEFIAAESHTPSFTQTSFAGGISTTTANHTINQTDWSKYASISGLSTMYVNVIPEMTSNDEPSGFASSSSEYPGGYSAYKAFNRSNDQYNGWYSSPAQDMPQWVSYQFLSSKTIVRYGMRIFHNDGMPRAWRFEGSNNGANWTLLDTQGVPTIYTWVNNQQLVTFDIANTSAYLYYRIVVTVKSNGSYTGIDEIQMFEEEVGMGIIGGSAIFTDDGVASTTSTLAVSGGTFGAGENASTSVTGSGEGASVGLSFPGTWSEMTPSPEGFNNGALVSLGSGDYIYGYRGWNTTEFYRYIISTDSWEERASTLGTIDEGGALVYPGSGNFIYGYRGNNTTVFYRYDTVENSWETRTPTPGNVGVGGALVYPGSGNFIYGYRGNNTTAFYKYDFVENIWTTMAPTPGNVGSGGALTYPGTGNFIYGYRGNTTAFYKYDFVENIWTTMAPTPGNIQDGGALVYPGSGDYIYGTQGNTLSFYRYSISGNTWSIETPAPAYFNGSAPALVYPGYGNYIYGHRNGGNASLVRYEFPVAYSSPGTFTSTVIDLGAKADFTTMTYVTTTPGGTGITIDARAGNTATPDESWTEWSANTNIASGGDISGLEVRQYIQYRANLTTDDVTVTPTLDRVIINYDQYAPGNLISSAYDTVSVSNLITKIAWTETGTSTDETIKFQVRSASTTELLADAPWCGYVDCSEGAYFDSTQNGIALESGHPLNSGGDDRYLQYKVLLTSGGLATPALTGVTVSFDSPPTITKLRAVGDVNIYIGSIYADAGATATDATDGSVDVVTTITLNSETVGSVDTATINTYTITYTATDAAGYTATSIRIVNVLAIPVTAQLLSATITVDINTPQVLVGYNDTATSTVTIPDSVINATLNVSALTTSTETTTSATIPGAIIVNATTVIGVVSMEIPAGITIIAASSTWDGTINVPQVRPNSSVTAIPDSGKTATVFSVIEVGYGDVELNFDKAVRLVFTGQTGKDAGYSRGGVFTKIDATCSADTQTAGDALPAEGDCKISVGSDLIIWTKHFTHFVTYTQAASVGYSSSGGSYMSPPAPVAISAPVSVVPGCVTGDKHSATTGKNCFPALVQKLAVVKAPVQAPKLANNPTTTPAPETTTLESTTTREATPVSISTVPASVTESTVIGSTIDFVRNAVDETILVAQKVLENPIGKAVVIGVAIVGVAVGGAAVIASVFFH